MGDVALHSLRSKEVKQSSKLMKNIRHPRPRQVVCFSSRFLEDSSSLLLSAEYVNMSMITRGAVNTGSNSAEDLRNYQGTEQKQIKDSKGFSLQHHMMKGI